MIDKLSGDEKVTLNKLTQSIISHLSSKKNSHAFGLFLSDEEIILLSRIDFQELTGHIKEVVSTSFVGHHPAYSMASYYKDEWLKYNIYIKDKFYLSPKILEFQTSDLDSIKSYIIKFGMYPSDLNIESIYDTLDKKAKTELITIADLSVAKKALQDKDPDIRMIAFYRLGFNTHLTKMLKDSSAKIRKRAVEIIPCGDKRLQDMVLEKSKFVFQDVVRKIDKKHLPMLLANRNMNDPEVKYLFNQRISNLE